jgi:diguanylate cyclase (GGDEF)-like protein
MQKKLTDFYDSFLKQASEKKHNQFDAEKNYHYFFMIGEIGVAALQTKHALQDDILTAITPLFLRLEIACKACLQYGISEISYKEIFEHSPISLLEVDFSLLKDHLSQLKSKGIKNISEYFYATKGSIDDALKLVKVKNANLQAINLFAAKNKLDFSTQIHKMLGEDSTPLFCKLLSAIDYNNKNFHDEGIAYSLDGKKINIDLTYSTLPAHENNFEKVLFTIVDITELKFAESRLEFLATHDYLTGLPNRILLQSMLEASINRTARSNKGMALLYIDIDYFKLINDQFGHGAGDDLLIQMANQLKNLIRSDDFVARIGGDEFVIIINNINSKNEMVTIADKIQEKATKVYLSESHQLNISISIGASYFPEKNETSVSLMRHADSALYAAKSAGRNCVKFHEIDEIQDA